jgi:hypothetical protein
MPGFNQAKRASKNHSRVMPFLVPPSEFKPGELTQLGLTGTCELQICRSAGPWSLGTSDRVEHSIQNAYLKGMCAACISLKTLNSRIAIQLSEHFVYIENQFFITSYAAFLSPIHVCCLALMERIERWWRTWLLRTRLVTRSSIALFAHIMKAKSGSVASLYHSSLASPFPSIMLTPARQVQIIICYSKDGMLS